MAGLIRKAVMASGVAGILTVVAASPGLAQVVVVDPYGGPYGAYAGPYGAYAYSPRYRGYRSWDYPAGYDTGGMPYSYRELGWQPGPPGSAPANPCFPGQRAQNRC